MSHRNFRATINRLAKKVSAIIQEYWIDFWEGLFPTVTK